MSMHPRQRQMVIRRLGTGKGGQGVALKLIKTEDGEFDPTIGAIVQTTKEYNGSGVRVNYSAYTMRNFDIPYTDYQIYLSPLQSPPYNLYAGSLSWYAGTQERYIGVYVSTGVGVPADSVGPIDPPEEPPIDPVEPDPIPESMEMPTPEIDDVIEFMSKLVKVVEVHPFNENGFGCGWKLRVRTA